jgi:hypothetical protein
LVPVACPWADCTFGRLRARNTLTKR